MMVMLTMMTAVVMVTVTTAMMVNQR